MAIITSTLLSVNFKLYDRLGVDTFQAIVFNYITCIILSFIIVGDWQQIISITERPWFPISFFLGSSFIFAFNILAKTIQQIGITITTIFQKMSMVVTLFFAFFIFSESTPALKILGICLAIPAILLTYEKSGNSGNPGEIEISNKSYLYALSVFVMSGIIDYCFYYVKKVNLVVNDDMLFTGTVFGIAAAWGSLIILVQSIGGQRKINLKSLVAGIILGIPNVFSVYFILRSLDTGTEGSILFPILNVGVLILSAIIGLLLFKEKINRNRSIALTLAFLAIVLIGYSAYV